MKKLVDGGYLSWVYGIKGWNSTVWNRSVRYTFRNSIIVMDDPGSPARTEYYPEYKSRRAEKKALDPEKQLKAERVKEFRELILLKDPLLTCAQAPGLEADDLVAAAIWYGDEPVDVVAVDKDYLQLPWTRFRALSHDHEPLRVERYAASLPVTISYLVRRPEDVLFSLVVMGDKSDSVPRLVPPRRLDVMVDMLSLTGKDRWVAALGAFGPDLIRNLNLVVLPGPWAFNPVPDPMTVYELVRDGGWIPDNPDLLRSEPILFALSQMAGRSAPVNHVDEDW